ncbi:hypothetical protein C8J57DRAFT_1713296 [Mycena rebaudengoi]|nr:hypothetical protein C8J57DRAFT_1713296 [Mycena rebaudengoi]
MPSQSPLNLEQIELAWAYVRSQSFTAGAALFMHGLFLLLFGLAMFFLLQSRAQGYYVLVGTAVLLAICAILQVILDVALAGIGGRILELAVREGITQRVSSLNNTLMSLYNVRQVALAVNNAIADLLFLYRCSLMWTSYRHAQLILVGPLIFIAATAVVGCLAVAHIVDIRIPYILALITNAVLLGLTAGRIFWKGQEAALLLGNGIRRKYNATVEIVFESSLLYFVGVLLYVISVSTSEAGAPFSMICWGGLAQLVNIVPMIIIVRVALAKNFGASDSHAYHGTGDNSATVALSARSPRSPKYQESSSGRGSYESRQNLLVIE